MKFKFIGNPNNRSDYKDSIIAFGIRFELGKATIVDDPFTAKKLANNPHFVECNPKKGGSHGDESSDS